MILGKIYILGKEILSAILVLSFYAEERGNPHMAGAKKVLIISTGGLIKDGITSVITSYLKAMDRKGLDIFILGTICVEESIRKDIEGMGCVVIDFPNRKEKPLKYMAALARFIRKEHIDIVHTHGNSGTMAIEMTAAWLGGCKRRMAHSHNTKCEHIKADKVLRPIFNLLYTDAFACGEDAGKWLFGNRCFKILKNGRDISLYAFNENVREKERKELGINEQLAIGHVGGFVEQKNHRFLLEIYEQILRIEPTAKLFMIGDGPLKSTIEEIARSISNNIIFTGNVDCTADLLQAMVGMILPSLFEGLPLVAVEWQINGLPCILSDVVTKECAFSKTVEFLSLDDRAEKWAKRIVEIAHNSKRSENASDAVKQAQAAGFDIKDNAALLKQYYMS